MFDGQIDQIRRFNRAFTQRIGALSESFHGRGRPLGEARLLFEIGPEGADVRDLRARLGLDSGYLSRLLRGLEQDELIVIRPSAADRRVRQATLTAKGLREWRVLDRLSDKFAADVLAPLGEKHRQQLVAAMETVERLMRAAAVQIAPAASDSAEARHCLRRYFEELAARFDAGFDPGRSISADPEELTPPQGLFVLARLDGRPIGCGALKVKPKRIGEIKRMWVDADARGLHVGRRILQTLEERAPSLGIAILRLETNRSLVEAQAMYRACGYAEVAPFNDEPYAHHWFEKRL